VRPPLLLTEMRAITYDKLPDGSQMARLKPVFFPFVETVLLRLSVVIVCRSIVVVRLLVSTFLSAKSC
jgi:hypothetical protein